MASSSGYSSSKPPRKYEVFLNFRGEDTRNSFVSHLYTALDERGIITYIDEHNLESGQSISPELLKSIQESKFAIIVFSKDYASSTWCLDELVQIMGCKTMFGQTVIPVFYDVDPSDVRKQKNSFAESFAKHEVNFKDNMEKVQIWKEALRQAANLSGKDIRGRNEASLIKEIVKEIFSQLRPKFSTKDLVGIESRMTKLSSLLFREPNDVCFVGIWGMGGIGKTTIARAIFDKHIDEFEGGCFLQDVSKQGMVDLQKILLSKVLKLEHVNISDANEGSNTIKDRFCRKRVLLVFDDVDDIKQLKSLAGERDWFGVGSRIIITTRDNHLLEGANETYAIDFLSDSEAMQLFCWHAFKKSHPAENFVQLSHRVVEYACGLPLALEVLGYHLHGRGTDVWKSALDKLKDAPEDKIIFTLEISFRGLSNFQQKIFLDIACFHRWESEDVVIRKLHSFGFHPVEGMAVLIQKSLLHISDGHIQMHDLIQEMGRHIVRREANDEPGRYSRLWLEDDVIDVLTNNTATDEIECMVLKSNFKIKLRGGSFRNMKRLRLLEVNCIEFSRGPDYLSNRLRWLYWYRYPAESLPENFEPTKLVSLILPGSLIVRTPDFSVMPNLEVLDLSHCAELLEVHPSIGVHRKLVHLKMIWCINLKRFPRIIQMESLEILDLFYCPKLQRFPEIEGNMSRLRILRLENTGVRELPWSLGGLTGLQDLNLSGCKNLRALPSSLCGLKNLECISLGDCNNLDFHCFDSQPSSLKKERAEYHGTSNNIKMLPALLSLPSLRKFSMVNCNVSELIFPESIGCLPSLQELHLGFNKFISLPESINRFSCLQILHLHGCEMLEALPELPSSIKRLVLYGCTRLTRIPNLLDLLSKYEHLYYLSLEHCWQLVRQTDALQQSVPQFLSAFRDWGSVSNVLCTRKEVLQVHLPGTELPDWLKYQSHKSGRIALSPPCYTDKLRGVSLCISEKHKLILTRVANLIFSPTPKHIFFFYIPIGTFSSGRKREELNDGCLFEVRRSGYGQPNVNTWGFRLVYEGEVDTGNSDITVTNIV